METIKTLEFKLYLNYKQTETLNEWLDKGRKIWNAGLAVLLELQQQKFRKKAGLDPLDGNELWEFYPNKDVKGKTVFGSCCSIVTYNRKHNEYRPACGIRYPKKLEGAEKSLLYQSSGTYGVCTCFKRGILSSLQESWKAYQDPNRTTARKPKFKGYKFPLKTLSNANASTTVKIVDSNSIKFPLIGILKTKGLDRVPKDAVLSVARITKKASGWYLQLAVKYEAKEPVIKYPDVAVAVDPGVKFATTTDYGRQVESPKFLDKQKKKLKREQRKLSRRTLKGANWEKQSKKVAILHEKIARQRNAFWHKESTYFVTQFGGIAIEDNSLANMGRRAKAKPKADGNGYEKNGGTAKTGLNKSLRDVAYGKFKVMVESKAKEFGNEVHLVKPHYNSQTCPKCGHASKDNRRSQSVFKCINCGHTDNADVNAAINIFAQSNWERPYTKHTPSC